MELNARNESKRSRHAVGERATEKLSQQPSGSSSDLEGSYMVWFNGAKREVLGGDRKFCEQVEGSALANIWEANNANLQYTSSQSKRCLAHNGVELTVSSPSNI